jgi:hypothetical protein
MKKLDALAAPIARLCQPLSLHPLLPSQRGERSPACLFLLHWAGRRVKWGAIAMLYVASLAVWLMRA